MLIYKNHLIFCAINHSHFSHDILKSTFINTDYDNYIDKNVKDKTVKNKDDDLGKNALAITDLHGCQ